MPLRFDRLSVRRSRQRVMFAVQPGITATMPNRVACTRYLFPSNPRSLFNSHHPRVLATTPSAEGHLKRWSSREKGVLEAVAICSTVACSALYYPDAIIHLIMIIIYHDSSNNWLRDSNCSNTLFNALFLGNTHNLVSKLSWKYYEHQALQDTLLYFSP